MRGTYSLTFVDEWETLVFMETSAAERAGMKRTRKLNAEDVACCRTAIAPKLPRSRAREYAGWFKALSDPTRIRILNLLAANRDPVCVCDIVKHFPIGQPTISHHLKILRDTCFVQSERRGTFMYYRVNRNCLAEFPGAARLIMDV
jgi:DNA-binding transcriptional ArsR family regulator